MRNFNNLTIEEIDLQIAELEKQLQQKQSTLEDRISALEAQNWNTYKNELKFRLNQKIKQQTNQLKEKIGFQVVCERFINNSDLIKIMSCIDNCAQNDNWKMLQKVYSDKSLETDRDLISFVATFYRQNILNEKGVYVKNVHKVKFEQILENLQQIAN